MPPKKKSQVNRTGIYYLADEYRKKHHAYLRTSSHDLIIHLLPCWRSMTLVEKKPYEDLAKQYKRARTLSNEHVNTPVIPSSEEIAFLAMNSSENTFLDAFFSRDLLEIFQGSLLFVTFQIFCRTDDEDGGDYFPAEIAIMKYSFCQTSRDEYFTIMKPEKFPLGYTGTAIDVSRETHQIPPFDFIGANGDYAQIWNDVKRVIGETRVNEPIVVFCNAFERDQTRYLLDWLASKVVQRAKPVFRVCSFEALVPALLRRLGLGDFAHQSVREQLRRPLYTLQIKERCIYHDSLAIQYCCRAINHAFSLFLDGFIRERFIHIVSKDMRAQAALATKEPLDQRPTVGTDSSASDADSISSVYMEKRLPPSFIQPMERLSLDSKPVRAPSPIRIDCRWPDSSSSTDRIDDEDQYIMTGRGLSRKARAPLMVKSHVPDTFSFGNCIGRGRRMTFLPSLTRFPISFHR